MSRNLAAAILVASSTIAVFSSSAAAAKPEFRFTLSGTEAQEREQKKLTFKLSAALIETVALAHIKCTGGTGDGEIEAGKAATSSKKVTEVFITLTGCEDPGVKAACTTTGHNPGEVVTKTLEGTLGYFNEALKEAGLDLWPKSRSAAERTNHEFNAVIATFQCEGRTMEGALAGGVIGKIAPINKKVLTTEHLTVTYQQTAGIQAWTKLVGVEGGIKNVLDASIFDEPPAEAGLETSNEVKAGTTLEVSV